MFVFVLNVLPSERRPYAQKGPLTQREDQGLGAYPTYTIAAKDVIGWRMHFEGFKETEDGWVFPPQAIKPPESVSEFSFIR